MRRLAHTHEPRIREHNSVPEIPEIPWDAVTEL